jgi:hypothetical protein
MLGESTTDKAAAPLDGSHEQVVLPPHGKDPVTEVPDYTRNTPLVEVAPDLKTGDELDPQDLYTVPPKVAPAVPKPAESHKVRNRLIGLALVGAVGTGGVAAYELGKGGKSSPKVAARSSVSPSSSATAPVSPTNTPSHVPSSVEAAPSTAPDGKLWSIERATMIPVYSEKDDLVNPAYFEPNGDVDSNINKAAVTETINNLMHNRWYAVSTGKKDDLLATFGKSRFDTAAGAWGAIQPEVAAVNIEHQQDVDNLALDSNYPIGSTVVTKINDIKPIVSPEVVEVTTEVLSTNYTTNSEGLPAPSTVSERVTMDLEYKKITGWTDGGERTMWVITGWQVNTILG